MQVGNIPAAVLGPDGPGYIEDGNGSSNCGATVLEAYRYPHIPLVSDRYGLFLFQQPDGATTFQPLPSSILNFDVTGFIDQYGLKGPVATNFFVAVYVSVSPFTGTLYSGNADVPDVWHSGIGTGNLVPQPTPGVPPCP